MPTKTSLEVEWRKPIEDALSVLGFITENWMSSWREEHEIWEIHFDARVASQMGQVQSVTVLTLVQPEFTKTFHVVNNAVWQVLMQMSYARAYWEYMQMVIATRTEHQDVARNHPLEVAIRSQLIYTMRDRKVPKHKALTTFLKDFHIHENIEEIGMGLEAAKEAAKAVKEIEVPEEIAKENENAPKRHISDPTKFTQ